MKPITKLFNDLSNGDERTLLAAIDCLKGIATNAATPIEDADEILFRIKVLAKEHVIPSVRAHSKAVASQIVFWRRSQSLLGPDTGLALMAIKYFKKLATPEASDQLIDALEQRPLSPLHLDIVEALGEVLPKIRHTNHFDNAMESLECLKACSPSKTFYDAISNTMQKVLHPLPIRPAEPPVDIASTLPFKTEQECVRSVSSCNLYERVSAIANLIWFATPTAINTLREKNWGVQDFMSTASADSFERLASQSGINSDDALVESLCQDLVLNGDYITNRNAAFHLGRVKITSQLSLTRMVKSLVRAQNNPMSDVRYIAAESLVKVIKVSKLHPNSVLNYMRRLNPSMYPGLACATKKVLEALAEANLCTYPGPQAE